MDINELYISMTGTVKLKPIDEGFKVFHNKTKATGLINEDGKKLLEFCNGKNRIEDIIDQIANSYAGEKKETEQLVIWGLKHFKWINLVKTMKTQIKDEYAYYVFDAKNVIELDHGIFDLSKLENNTLKLIDEIKKLDSKGVFQFSLVCSRLDDKKITFEILEKLKENDIIINLVIRENIFTQEEVEKLSMFLRGKILMELNEDKVKEINADVRNSEFVKSVRKITDLEIPFEIQLNMDDVDEFDKFIEICSLINIKKVYYSCFNVQLVDELKARLDNIENKLFSSYRMIPECIEGSWFNSNETENISFLEKINMGD